MASKKLFIILNNRDQNGYIPGSTISGQVVINNDRIQKTTGIKIALTGTANVGFNIISYRRKRKRRRKVIKTLTAHELLFAWKVELLQLNGARSLNLQPGWHVYPFEFRLQPDIPSSFTGENGKIEYIFTATMKRSFFNTNKTATLPLIVADYLDLNHVPRALVPISEQYKKRFCFLRCSNPVEIILRGSKSGFAPNEMVTMDLQINNKSRSKVKRGEIFLVQEVSYHTTQQTSVKYKRVLLTISSSVPRGEYAAFIVMFKIPNTMATNLSSWVRRIISLQYFLELKLKFSCWDKDFVRRIPIIIGTVPLDSHSDHNAGTSSVQNVSINNPPTDCNIPTIMEPEASPSAPFAPQNSYNPRLSVPFDERDSDSDYNASIGSGVSLPPAYEKFEDLPPSYTEAIKLEMSGDGKA